MNLFEAILACFIGDSLIRSYIDEAKAPRKAPAPPPQPVPPVLRVASPPFRGFAPSRSRRFAERLILVAVAAALGCVGLVGLLMNIL